MSGYEKYPRSLQLLRPKWASLKMLFTLSCIGMQLFWRISFYFILICTCTIFAGGGASQEKQNSVRGDRGWQHLSGWLWNPQRQGKQIWLLKISHILGVSTGWKGGKKDKGRWFFRFTTRCLILTRWTPFNGCANGLVLPWGSPSKSSSPIHLHWHQFHPKIWLLCCLSVSWQFHKHN